MIDTHIYNTDWGVMPYLFRVGSFQVPAYSFFVMLGILVGMAFYFIDGKRSKVGGINGLYIFLSAMFFGALGAKLPIWLSNYKLLWSDMSSVALILSGRTVIGGLIGGMLGVALVKRLCKIKTKMGNQIAPAAALGIAIGRLGCFFRGCCYGDATQGSFGVNFGDGILRHPTQLYESLFDFGLFLFLLVIRKKVTEPGRLFKIFVTIYFVFRFFIEFIRIHPVAWMGLTWFQIVCLGAVVWINRKVIFNTKNGYRKKEGSVYER